MRRKPHSHNYAAAMKVTSHYICLRDLFVHQRRHYLDVTYPVCRTPIKIQEFMEEEYNEMFPGQQLHFYDSDSDTIPVLEEENEVIGLDSDSSDDLWWGPITAQHVVQARLDQLQHEMEDHIVQRIIRHDALATGTSGLSTDQPGTSGAALTLVPGTSGAAPTMVAGTSGGATTLVAGTSGAATTLVAGTYHGPLTLFPETSGAAPNLLPGPGHYPGTSYPYHPGPYARASVDSGNAPSPPPSASASTQTELVDMVSGAMVYPVNGQSHTVSHTNATVASVSGAHIPLRELPSNRIDDNDVQNI